jgi:predicted nucleic acid-binding protein
MEGSHPVGPKQDLVLVDTNIFVIDLRYKRDAYYKINRAFLDYIAEQRNGFTTIVNLMELCGILSFNLNEKQLTELWFYFQDRYRVVVLPVPILETNFPTIEIKEIFDLLKRKTSLGDALMTSVAKKHLPFISTMITWDNLHFKNIFHGTVLTPEELLQPSDDDEEGKVTD